MSGCVTCCRRSTPLPAPASSGSMGAASKLFLDCLYHIRIPASSSMQQLGFALFFLFLSHVFVDDLCIAASVTSTAFVASQWQISPQESNLTVLANANFSLILTRSSSPNGPRCTLLVQHIASGLQVWVANFYNSSTSSMALPQNCTFSLQRDGNLQLIENTQLSWQTSTGSTGVSSIQLLDTGNLVLLANGTYTNTSLNVVWQSFEHPSDVLVTGQNFGLDATLYAAELDNDYKTGGLYSMALSKFSNELLLYAFFNQTPRPQQYWSLEATFAPLKNASVCCLASYLQVGNGLTIFDNQSEVVISISGNNLNPDKDLFEYAKLERNGNLCTYVFKGGSWQLNFKALSRACQHPNDFCYPYGICDSAADACSTRCLSGFGLVNRSDPSYDSTSSWLMPSADQCQADVPRGKTVEIGYMYSFPEYIYSGGQQVYKYTQTEWQASCLNNCSRQTAFYSGLTGCYLTSYPLRTIQQTGDDTPVMFLTISNVSYADMVPVSPSHHTHIQLVERVHAGLKKAYAIGFGCGAAAVTLGGLATWFMRNRKVRGMEQLEEDEIFLHTVPGLPPRFSFKDLLKATDGFSRKIGAGGFGSVYEGFLSGQETRLAIKELKNTQQSGIKQFRAEIATLGKISHTNLVRLCGYCIEGSHRLLVYEFMVNKSLDRALFSEDGAVMLDWNMRHAIALGSARGLAYLHDECTSRIIHCDVKPENILLDHHWVPKVSDFGLAKLMSRDQSYTATTMRGTRGYLAPEWIRNAPITEKSDVFSFGIVLLELVAGRRSFDLRFQQTQQCYLPAWAFDLVGEGADLLVLIDEKLPKDTPETEQAVIMAKIALWCIQEEATLRPPMSLVVKMLEGEAKVLPPPVCHFFDKARPHPAQVELPVPGSLTDLSVEGSASHQTSQVSLQMSCLVSGR